MGKNICGRVVYDGFMLGTVSKLLNELCNKGIGKYFFMGILCSYLKIKLERFFSIV